VARRKKVSRASTRQHARVRRPRLRPTLIDFPDPSRITEDRLLAPTHLPQKRRPAWYRERLAEREDQLLGAQLDELVWRVHLEPRLREYRQLLVHLKTLQTISAGFGRTWFSDQSAAARRATNGVKVLSPKMATLKTELKFHTMASPVLPAWGRWLSEYRRRRLPGRSAQRLATVRRVVRGSALSEAVKRQVDVESAQPAAIAACLEALRPLLHPSRDPTRNSAIVELVGYCRRRGETQYKAVKAVTISLGLPPEQMERVKQRYLYWRARRPHGEGAR